MHRLIRAIAVLTVFAAGLLGPFVAAAHADGYCVDVYNEQYGWVTVCSP